MTLADWVDESRQRFEEQPAQSAVSESAREFCRGLSKRAGWLVYGSVGQYQSTIADAEVTFAVDCPTDLERARSCNREQPVIEWLLSSADSETVVWDVGAYHGHYSTVAAAQGATVVAFEPHSANQQRIQQNAALNDVHIDVRGVALSDKYGMRAFGGGPTSELAVGEGEQSVRTERGDGIQPRPDIVKIDVEGHELAVLEGLSRHLEHVRRIAIEVHDGVQETDVRERLEQAGLGTREIETDRSQTYIGGVRALP